MKRYLIFAFDDYYPSGGAYDLLGSVDEMPDLAAAQAFTDDAPAGYLSFDNYTVLDTETGEVFTL